MGPAFGNSPVEMPCADGVVLRGDFWPAHDSQSSLTAIINPATGVLARYYHRYARYLTANGFNVLTYDYRGIGASRPVSLRGCGYRWSDWGEFDFDAALRWVAAHVVRARIVVIGHSIGGFLPGLAKAAPLVERMLTIGAQFAYWPDYALRHRTRLFLKWHVAMPAMTALFGYFPGRRLGWLEDLPSGVAYEWSFRRSRMEFSYPAHQREDILARFDAFTAPILAVTMHDDEFATPAALRRGLSYYRAAERRTAICFEQDALGIGPQGHFGLFHASHRDVFWKGTVLWLRDGVNPWRDLQTERHESPCR
jgi:predicted alpha/beta hydrolase